VLSCAALVGAAAGRDAQSAPVGTGSLAGRVIGHDDGKPVAGARVNLSLEGRQLRETHADGNGEYAFPRLPRGLYQLRAYLPGFLYTSYGQQKPNRNGQPIVLGDGQALRNLTIRLFRGAVIAGSVYGHQGQPLAGADVYAYKTNYRPGGQVLDHHAGVATDDRGSYRFFGLPPGEYLIRVVNTTGGRMAIADRALDVQWTPSEGYVPTFFPAASSPGEAAPIVLEAGEERAGVDLALPLTKLFRVRGRLDGTADSIANARFVRLFDGTSGLVGRTLDAQVNPDGQFVLTDVPAGLLTVLVRATPGQRERSETGRRGPIYSLWGLGHLAVSGDISDAVISLQPGATVSGTVKTTGAAAPFATSTTLEVGVTEARPSALLGEILTGTIDRDGRFSIRNIPPGPYYLRTINLPTPWVMATITQGAVDRTATAITVTTDDVNDIVITLADRSSSLSGTVQRSAGPATGHTVIAFPADPRAWAAHPSAVYAAAVDSSGTYTMRRVLPGQYLLAVVADIESNTWFNPRVLEELSRGAARVSIGIGESKVQDLRVAGG